MSRPGLTNQYPCASSSAVLLCDHALADLVITIVDIEACGPEVVVTAYVIEQGQTRLTEHSPRQLMVISIPGKQIESIGPPKAVKAIRASQAVTVCANDASCLLDGLIQKVRNSDSHSYDYDADVGLAVGIGSASDYGLTVPASRRRCEMRACKVEKSEGGRGLMDRKSVFSVLRSCSPKWAHRLTSQLQYEAHWHRIDFGDITQNMPQCRQAPSSLARQSETRWHA